MIIIRNLFEAIIYPDKVDMCNHIVMQYMIELMWNPESVIIWSTKEVSGTFINMIP